MKTKTKTKNKLTGVIVAAVFSMTFVATVSARLGHAQITTTYNFYVHPLKSHDKMAGNVLENLLVPSKAN